MTYASTTPSARPRARARRSVIALAALAALAGCSSSTTAPNSGGTTTTPPVTNKGTVNATPSFTFAPTPLTVAPGDTVTFAFGTLAHNVFFDTQPSAPADIPGSNANVSVKRAFATAGTYRYTCHIHPSMVGTIVVQAASASVNVGGA